MPDVRPVARRRQGRAAGPLVACLAGLIVLVAGATPAAAQPPGVSIWYDGSPAGSPRQRDLGVLRVLGFESIVWPADREAGVPELQRLAEALDLAVTVVPRPVPILPAAAGRPPRSVFLTEAEVPVELLSAVAWRALAHGARTFVVDPGGTPEGPAELPGGGLRPWVRPVQALARQLSANAALFRALQPGPSVVVDGGGADVDVALLQTPRSWVIVVTSFAPDGLTATATFPPEVPAALWASLLDAEGMSMRSDPGGPVWTFDLPARGVLAYLIEKSSGR